jgi:hypothetical protein
MHPYQIEILSKSYCQIIYLANAYRPNIMNASKKRLCSSSIGGPEACAGSR